MPQKPPPRVAVTKLRQTASMPANVDSERAVYGVVLQDTQHEKIDKDNCYPKTTLLSLPPARPHTSCPGYPIRPS